MFNEVIEGIARNAMAANPNAGKEYMGEDGLLHCGVCHEPVQQYVEEMKRFLNNGYVPIPCRCTREKFRRAEEENERAKARARVAELQQTGFSDPMYLRHTFERDNGSSPQAREAAEWYVEEFQKLKAEGKGMMFIGGTGTGKTFYACCIANALIERGVPVWVTTMQPLLRKAGDFNTADSVFNHVKTAELLVLDDFGTTQNSARNLDLLFELIDTRARSGLPLIVTTNLCAEDFDSEDIALKRIYSRLKGMCCTCVKSPVIMNGSDLRVQSAREAHS